MSVIFSQPNVTCRILKSAGCNSQISPTVAQLKQLYAACTINSFLPCLPRGRFIYGWGGECITPGEYRTKWSLWGDLISSNNRPGAISRPADLFRDTGRGGWFSIKTCMLYVPVQKSCSMNYRYPTDLIYRRT